MSAMWELREGLRERGESWHKWPDEDSTTWQAYSNPHTATESMDGTLIVTGLTPAQAIAATLGPKVCHMKETVYPFSDKDEYWMVCSECGFSIYMRRGWQPLRYCSHCGARVTEVTP